MKNYRMMLAAVAAVLMMSLSGCFLPEDFDVTIKVKRDGSYTFRYDGNLIFTMALSAIEDGTFTKKDEASLKEQEKDMLESPGVKKAKYIGNARYKVLVEQTGKAGEDYDFISKEISFFSIKGQDDGTLEIKAFKLSEEEIEGVKASDYDFEGTLSVSVEKGVKVLEHNARTVSSGVYRWKIKNPETAPLIIVKP